MKKILFEDTRVDKIGKNATILSVSRMMNLAVSMITSMLLSRFRTLTEYGTFSEITTAVSIAISIICIGFPSCLNYFVPRCVNQKERDEFLSFYYMINTVLGIITGIVLCVTTPIIASYYNNSNIITYTYVFALLPLSIILHKSRDNLFVSTNQCMRAITYNLAQTFSNLFIIILTRALDESFSFYFALYMFDSVVFGAMVYFEALRLVDKVRLWPPRGMLKEVLAFSIPLGISSAVATINLDLDKLIIGRLFDTEYLAIYASCGKELPIVFIATSFSAVLMPVVVKNIAERENRQAVYLWKLSVEFSMIIIAFFTAASVVFAPQMITVLYSEKYLPGVTIFRIYSLVLLFRVTAFAMMLQALGKTKIILYNSIAVLVSNCILNWLLYYMLGFSGPAVATLVTVAINCLINLMLSCKYLRINFGEIFPWRRVARIIAVNIAGGVLTGAVLKAFNIGTSSIEIITAIVIGCVWMGAYFLFVRKRILILWEKMNAEENEVEKAEILD